MTRNECVTGSRRDIFRILSYCIPTVVKYGLDDSILLLFFFFFFLRIRSSLFNIFNNKSQKSRPINCFMTVQVCCALIETSKYLLLS